MEIVRRIVPSLIGSDPLQRVPRLEDRLALRLPKLADGQIDREGGALPRRALDAHMASMHLHDLLDDAQAQPGAGYPLDLGGLGAEEAVEDKRQVVRRNADPRIPD